MFLCRPGDDFLAWKTRVINIIVGATFAMAVSWLVLPYYASAEHLDLLAEAYCGAGKFIGDGYNALYCNFQAAAQVPSICCRKVKSFYVFYINYNADIQKLVALEDTSKDVIWLYKSSAFSPNCCERY